MYFSFEPEEIWRELIDRGMSIRKFARLAGLDFKTVRRALDGEPVQEKCAIKILDVFDDALTITEVKN